MAALQLSEQSEELARQKRRREDVGVQLYQVQQQLAKLGHNMILPDSAFGLGDDELAGFVQGGLTAIHVEPALRNRVRIDLARRRGGQTAGQ